MSDGLKQNQDTVAVIFDLLEGELYQQHVAFQDNGSPRFIARGLQFLATIISVAPSRAWPYLSRSGLLGIHGGESKLTAVMTATEIPSGEYPVLLSSLNLFEAMIDDVISNAVPRKSSKSLNRFSAMEVDQSGTGIPESNMRKLLLQLTRIAVDVFQSCTAWKFANPRHKVVLDTRICRIFVNIVSVCYDVDDEPNVDEKLLGSLGPSAKHLMDTFLTHEPNDLILSPLLQLLAEGLRTRSGIVGLAQDHTLQLQTVSALNLCDVFLRLNTFLVRPMSEL